MKKLRKLLLGLSSLTLLVLVHSSALAGNPTTGFLFTNDDKVSNSTTFFPIAADGTLGNPSVLTVGGRGPGGGYFAANRVVVLNNGSTPCAYLSAGISNSIAGVQILTQTSAGNFFASSQDNGTDNGIGMVVNNNYLYAAFSSSGTIGTFTVEAGCGLEFLGDITPVGLNGGNPKGMALFGNLLIVTYGDGSIESFNISAGIPVSNGDAQNSTGSSEDNFPDGVAITPDGHYAIFGDDSSDATVEVSDISSGTLTPTVVYGLPSGFNSNNVLLSPDGTLLYVVNNTSGQVSAAFFNPSTGVISGNCISAQLSGFDSSFNFVGAPATQLSVGTGSVLYVAEFGVPSTIAIVDVNANAANGECTLTEAPGSPVTDPYSLGLLSIAVLPATTQAGIYNPAPDATMTGNTATFDWSAYSGATAYWLDIGAEQGGHEYYSSGSLPTTTLTLSVNSLPVNGSTIWARWYYLLGGTWQHLDYSYIAFGTTSGIATMTSPAPSTTLSGSSITFTWNAGTNAAAYWLDIGSTAGAHDYFSSGNLGGTLTEAVTGLPTNGSTVYVTLYSLVNGSWQNNAYTYTAFSLGSASGVLTSPTPGSILTGSTVTFDWTAGSGASGYWIDIGSTAGAHNIYSSGNLGNVLTATVNGLPTDGSSVYVTLYTLIAGSWSANDYSYTAFNSIGGLAVMQTPPPGTILSGYSVTFAWSSDSSATGYWVDVGSTAGAHDIYSSGNLGTTLTLTVNSLPANGSTIYVTLYSYVGGAWSNNAYTYVSGP
jgi:lactonase family protein with 7-bladed beta-propeller